LLLAIDEARRKRVANFKSAVDSFHFLLRQVASADAAEYSIVLVHTLSPFQFVNFIADLQKEEARRIKARATERGEPSNSQPHPRADLHPEKERRCRVKEYGILR
jgi:hypothetical protein